MQAMNSATAVHMSIDLLPVKLAAASLMALMSRLPNRNSNIAVPTNRPMSPVRTVKNAFNAARLFACSSHQWPMSMNEQRPMISQPRMNCTMFGASTMVSMPAENRVRLAKKWV